jgi:hypothetical protein
MSTAKPKHPYRELFSTLKHLPFLFIGSGISRRYMKLPNWEELLRHFASKVHPANPLALEVFVHQAGGKNWPAVSTLIESEFNSLWLTSPDFEKQRAEHQAAVKAGTSPFKLELAAYFRRAKKSTEDPHLQDEVSCLVNVAKRSVAGVITTNFDLLPEEVFKGYSTFVGQEQLLFGGTQGVSEIYKIHGCCTQPGSIVMTASDYQDFERRNAYLAAKLLTIFVEHPVIFIGYSLSDPNIQSILSAIIDCLSEQNLQVLKQQMIFVEYSDSHDQSPEISEHSVSFKGGTRSIKMTKITLHDFLPFYSELLAQKYQYNPKLLRQLKRDIYKLVTTNEPVDRFQIQDIEDDEGLEKVGVLAGVGVVVEQGGPERGHRIPDTAELFCDVVFNNGDFDLKSLVEDALGKLQKSHSHSLPIHKYVEAYREQFKAEPPTELLKECKDSLEGLFSTYLKKLRSSSPIESIEELERQATSKEKWLELFPRVRNLEACLPQLEQFLQDYLKNCPETIHNGKQADKTNLKRVIRIYDWLKYGKTKDARLSSKESNLEKVTVPPLGRASLDKS